MTNTIGGDWALVGLAGLRAAAEHSGIWLDGEIDKSTAVRLTGELSLSRGWFPLCDLPPAQPLKQLHLGLQRTLCGHGKQRRFSADGGLIWIKQQGCAQELFGKSGPRRQVKLTRAILPNWIDSGERFAASGILPLYFIPLASLSLPLPGGAAVLLAPITLEAASAVRWCREIVPSQAEEFWPASAADAVLSLASRLEDADLLAGCIGVICYVYDWVQTNTKFREVKAVIRCDHWPDLSHWREFAASTRPIPLGEGGFIPDIMRGFVADNLLAGRRPYDRFSEFSKGKDFGHLRRGSQALFKMMQNTGS